MNRDCRPLLAALSQAAEDYRDRTVANSDALVLEAHHKGAVALAQVELDHGKDPEMRRLAEAVERISVPLGGGFAVSTSAANCTTTLCPAASNVSAWHSIAAYTAARAAG